eukprot:CAMPEP_0184659248 /NCGR_PEP_ID=MMETSP0308-20130426/28999_1 /TAXON_ID=38269 /ORGANISM="Gloeochaete witrockiana, Strain SAG 46.84" /LENGTH=352 /DNA_ID=CAMNT_0027098937 /DNA_START=270 /DNA_END=1328 /DNA_ORIENTATION=-
MASMSGDSEEGGSEDDGLSQLPQLSVLSATDSKGPIGKLRRASMAASRKESCLTPPRPRPTKSCPSTPNLAPRAGPEDPTMEPDFSLDEDNISLPKTLLLPTPGVRRLSVDLTSMDMSRRKSLLVTNDLAPTFAADEMAVENDAPEEDTNMPSLKCPPSPNFAARRASYHQALKEGREVYMMDARCSSSFIALMCALLAASAGMASSMQGPASAVPVLTAVVVAAYIWRSAARQYHIHPDRLEIVRSGFLASSISIPFMDIAYMESKSGIISKAFSAPWVFPTAIGEGLAVYTRSRARGIGLAPMDVSDFKSNFSDAIGAFHERYRPGLLGLATLEPLPMLRGPTQAYTACS